MKLTTAFIIGVFTVGSSYSLADHRHEGQYWKYENYKHHQAAKHHKKAIRHERQAHKHHRIAKRHERKAHQNHRQDYRKGYREGSHNSHYRYTHYRGERNHSRNFRGDGYGRVVSVEPIYRTVSVPVRGDSCVNYDRSRPNYTSHTATVLGAVIGGALGHRIGDSHGDPEVAAIAGGLLGASMGRDLDRRARYNRNVSVEGPCRVKQRYETRRELVEYKVSYRYNGEVHRARMDYDPGEWVKLDVDVSPA
jgi:uncharacterized protein YcfJ